tara:strand:+ start:15 stop:440 length:426 start_codon:yes stop_codon:yes gene_type:complete
MKATQLIMTSPDMSYAYMSEVINKNNLYQGVGAFFQQCIDSELIINFVNQDLIALDDKVFFTFWSVTEEKASEFLSMLQDRSILTSPTVVFESTGNFVVTFDQPDLNFDNNHIDFEIGTTLVEALSTDGSMKVFNELYFPE